MEPVATAIAATPKYCARGGLKMLRRFRSLLRVLKSRRAFEQGMTDELRFHIEQYADDLVRSGVSAQEAVRRARMECGGLPSVQEQMPRSPRASLLR